MLSSYLNILLNSIFSKFNSIRLASWIDSGNGSSFLYETTNSFINNQSVHYYEFSYSKEFSASFIKLCNNFLSKIHSDCNYVKITFYKYF